MKTSHTEDYVRRVLNYYLPNNKAWYNYRPKWLKNPATGKSLELDIYYPRLKLAVEIQGFHHKTKDQIKKDGLKQSLCRKREIFLMQICYLFRITQLLKGIHNHNPIRFEMFKNELPREFLYERNRYAKKIKKNVKKNVYSEYYRKVKFQMHLDKYYKRQKMETETNRRLRLAKDFSLV